MKTDGKRHLTIRATAEALEVPEGLVRRMVRAGEVEGYRVGSGSMWTFRRSGKRCRACASRSRRTRHECKQRSPPDGWSVQTGKEEKRLTEGGFLSRYPF